MQLLIDKLARDLNLEILSNKEIIDVNSIDVNRPGLFLSGFHSRFDPTRVQVIGTAEQCYLASLPLDACEKAIDALLEKPFPFMVISENVAPMPILTRKANEKGIALLKSKHEPATKLIASLSSYLSVLLAPMETVHAVLLDIYGLGVLLTGDSGIGKSETALELVKRGHRLVADDAVVIKKVSANRLIGEAPEKIKHLMEIRGVGIINVQQMYGISAVIDSKSIDLVVHLEFRDKNKDYDRLGLNQDRETLLGVSVPLLTIPVQPGRNLAIIMETAARSTRLKQAGYDPLAELMIKQ